jgi:lipopolysaccharide export system permease protein
VLKRGLVQGKIVLLVAIALLLSVGSCLWLVPMEWKSVAEHLQGFPDADRGMHELRPYVLGALCFLPTLAALCYAFAGILARWLTREFLQALFVCYGGILLVYFLIDFSGNAAGFSEGEGVGAGAWFYYKTMSPAIVSLLLPFGMLFSVLFCVAKVSRSREVVAALQSGRSMFRVMLPLYMAAIFATLFNMGCQFQWAPTAEGMKSATMDEARGNAVRLMEHAVFYYPQGRRVWMVKEIPRSYEMGAPLRGVEVTTLHEDGALASRLYAREAQWKESDGSWSFQGVEIADHHKNEAPVFVKKESPYVMRDWRETPAQIVKVGLDVRHLGVPDLSGIQGTISGAEWQSQDVARYSTQWHYRFSLPLTCLVYVMFAVPMTLYVTRRASGAAMAVTIILAIQLVLFSTVALALGESGNLSPKLAAWGPVVFFALLGMWLMNRRSSGRPLWPIVG